MTGFADAFSAYASRPCLREGTRTLTYAEALALGREIVGPLPRERALVMLRCSLTIPSVAAYMALMADGHVPLLLESSLAQPLLDGLAELYRPDVILDPASGERAVSTDASVALHSDLGLLLTTSGSTGSPKLVRLKTSGVVANAQAIAAYLGLSESERPLLHLPMSYSYGMSIINSHLMAGASICLTQKSVMEPGYWEELRRHEATSIAGVPFHYMAIRRLGEKGLDIPSLKTLTQAGGRLDPKIIAFFADWAGRTGRRFFVMYGQTEAGPRIAYLPPEQAATAPEAIGVPIDGVSIDLLDDAGVPVAEGAEGEMVVRGPSVMMGYALAAEDLSRGDDLGGVLKTGDLAKRGEDGLLRITGRAARMLKIYGLRVNLEEIDRRLADLGHSAVAFGTDDALRILIEGEADAQSVREQVVELFSLPPRGIEVRCCPGITRSATGKITATALNEAWETAGQPATAGSAA